MSITPPLLTRWRLSGLRTLTIWVLLAERGLTHLWPLFMWCALFGIAWLLQVPAVFGLVVEVAVAVAFAIGAIVLLWRALAGLHWPGRHDVTRRIEQDNHLAHRPLSALDDRLANPARQNTLLLWASWQARILPALKHLRWPRMQPVLAGRDPYALRALALVALLAAGIMAGPSWGERLKHGMIPVLPSIAAAAGEKTVLWITPPAYTGQKQIVLKGRGRNENPIAIPEGSVIKASVAGGFGAPRLLFDDSDHAMQALGKKSYGAEMPVPPAQTIAIRQMFLKRASWTIAYGADTPPVITQKAAAEIDPRTGDIKIPLTLEDNYSVDTLTATIRLATPGDNAPPFGNPVVQTRSIMSAPQTPMDFTLKLNAAWHPWVGMDVAIDITAQDHKGQTAALAPVEMKLPARPFRHPAASDLISLRDRLIRTPEASARNVAHDLEQIMARPDYYHGDARVFLSLRSAASHLVYDQARESIANVIAQLWDTALRIEDGDFSMARRSLLQAQQNLQNALKNPNSTPEEIAGLMESLRMAMAEYIQESFREMQKRMAESGQAMPMMSPEMFANNINLDDLAAFMDQMQAEALSGDRNAAREMLSQMERLMEMMDPSAMQTDMPKDMQAMMDGLEDLEKIIEAQKALLAETKTMAEQDGQPQDYSAPLPPDEQTRDALGLDAMPPPPQDTRQGQQAPTRQTDSAPQTAQQGEIRQILGDVAARIEESLGQSPDNMARADQAMRGAIRALERDMPGSAVPHQEDALKQLGDSRQQMVQQLAERMKQMMSMSFGAGPTDPLGRPMREGENGAPWSASTVKIPDEAERRKIHDILEQLRKKSGELQRPDYELDYYRRLMRQF